MIQALQDHQGTLGYAGSRQSQAGLATTRCLYLKKPALTWRERVRYHYDRRVDVTKTAPKCAGGPLSNLREGPSSKPWMMWKPTAFGTSRDCVTRCWNFRGGGFVIEKGETSESLYHAICTVGVHKQQQTLDSSRYVPGQVGADPSTPTAHIA